MKRDHGNVIAALIRKANDPACSGPEREALLAKAMELRDAHDLGEPRPRPVHNLFTGNATTTTQTVNGVTMTVTFVVSEWR